MNSYDEILNGVRSLANGEQPDIDLSELFYTHNCVYLLSLLKGDSAFTEKQNLSLAMNKIHIIQRFKVCKDIFDSFTKRGIMYAVIKGAVLSNAAYGSPVFRISGDVDILADRKNIDEIKNIMIENGFVQGRVTDKGIQKFIRKELIFQAGMSHQAAPFVKETGNRLCPYVNIDINLDIMWGESKRKADMELVLSETEKTDIYSFKVIKLAKEMEFISLCLHHYKDMNSIYLLYTGSLKLSLFCDIYYYIKNQKPDITKLKSLSEELNISDCIYYCIYYTRLVFGDAFLDSYIAVLETEKCVSLLNSFGLDENKMKEWDLPFAERLFTDELVSYLKLKLTDEDMAKVRVNMLYM